MAIAAEVQRIRDVFSATTDIRVPPFQRSYAWEDDETEILIKDLLDAFRHNTVYFLGAIVVIRPRNRGPSDVVDGQQRLTTLTIILAVLRDRLYRFPSHDASPDDSIRYFGVRTKLVLMPNKASSTAFALLKLRPMPSAITSGR